MGNACSTGASYTLLCDRYGYSRVSASYAIVGLIFKSWPRVDTTYLHVMDQAEFFCDGLVFTQGHEINASRTCQRAMVTLNATKERAIPDTRFLIDAT